MEIGGYFDGLKRYSMVYDKSVSDVKSYDELCEDMLLRVVGTDEFVDEVTELHLGEWRKEYIPEDYGYSVLDGTQWTVTVSYSNETKEKVICGSNVYPYNFDRFLELFGLDKEYIFGCEDE